jgi:hypothetical protein
MKEDSTQKLDGKYDEVISLLRTVIDRLERVRIVRQYWKKRSTRCYAKRARSGSRYCRD